MRNRLGTILSTILLVSASVYGAEMAGEYAGTWASDSGSSEGTLHVSVLKNADAWACKLAYTAHGEPEVTTKAVSCAMDGNKMKGQFDAEGDGGTSHITLQAVLTGNALEGTFAVSSAEGETVDSGKWKASTAH